MKSLSQVLLSFLLLLSVGTTSSEAIPWQKADFHYFAQDDNLRDMLKNFCIAQGINAVIDAEVSSKVSGLFEDVSPDFFLSKVCKAYGLVWFYDGNILHIDPFYKIESKILHTTHTDAEQILMVLSALGIEGSNFSVRGLKEQGILFLSGSPRFISTVTELVEKVEQNQVDLFSQQAMQVFPLKYSWAYDLQFAQNDSQVTIPGLATVLNNLMGTGRLMGQYARMERKVLNSAVTKIHKLRGEGVIGSARSKKRNPYKEEAEDEEDTFAPADKRMVSTGDSAHYALIDADVRLNAVVVKDIKSKLGLYKDLIDALDVPVEVISLAADIIDINANAGSDLGAQFASITQNGKTFQWNPPGKGADTFGSLSKGFNGLFTLPISRATISAQISALEEDGKAKVLSRPSVITLDNVEASISNQDTVYTKLIGAYDVDMSKVGTGTTLKVTPHVIQENGQSKIKMVVKITDGQQIAMDDKGEPRVQESSINTQAIVLHGQSLLLGGHFRENHAKYESGVPILKNIPVLGYLFKVTKNRDETRQRIFIITPHILNLSSMEGPTFNKEFPAAHGDSRDAGDLPVDYSMQAIRANGGVAPVPPIQVAVPLPTKPIQSAVSERSTSVPPPVTKVQGAPENPTVWGSATKAQAAPDRPAAASPATTTVQGVPVFHNESILEAPTAPADTTIYNGYHSKRRVNSGASTTKP